MGDACGTDSALSSGELVGGRTRTRIPRRLAFVQAILRLGRVALLALRDVLGHVRVVHDGPLRRDVLLERRGFVHPFAPERGRCVSDLSPAIHPALRGVHFGTDGVAPGRARLDARVGAVRTAVVLVGAVAAVAHAVVDARRWQHRGLVPAVAAVELAVRARGRACSWVVVVGGSVDVGQSSGSCIDV